MDRRASLHSLASAKGEKNTTVLHLETDSIPSIMKDEVQEEVRQTTNLTAKEQYAKLWAAIKADKRFCLWTGYTMLLVFGWGLDQGMHHIYSLRPREIHC